MTTALIDGDILIYKAACGAEKAIRWDDGVWTYHADEKDGIEIFENKLQKILEELKTEEYIMYVSDTKNFRKDIYEPYKANRDGKRKPLLLKFMQAYVTKQYNAVTDSTLEADDSMGIAATSGEIEDPIIVTIDKDLAQIPVKIYNLDTKEISLPEMRDPYRFFMRQVLTGDSVDNFPGCPGIGDKTVDKLFKDVNDPDALWGVVVAQYKKKKLTEADALVQARCAYILQAENYKDNKITMWEHSMKTRITKKKNISNHKASFC
jgi:DNA polymerase-1